MGGAVGKAPCLQFTRPPTVAESVVVKAINGQVKGFRMTEGGAAFFRGIPFAASTAGANRWKPPQPRDPWEGELDCTMYGEAVVQNSDTGLAKIFGVGTPEGGDIGKMGEDVLNLNVTTPSTTGSAPVMVWIHGGANKMGSAKGDAGGCSPCSTSRFADAGVVVVAIPYRMGLHGFWHMPKEGVTNLAIRDLIAGLQWIQDNIAVFGGDKNNVTIFGESSGGVNTCMLISSPLTQKLYHKAIVQSGGPTAYSAEDYDRYVLPSYVAAATPVLAAKGHKYKEVNLKAMEALTAEEVHLIGTKVADELKNITGKMTNPPNFNAYIGDDVLPKSPIESISAGVAKGKVLIFGHNSCEPSMFKAMLGSLTGSFLYYAGMLDGMVRDSNNYTLEDEKTMPAGCTRAAVKKLIAGHQKLSASEGGKASESFMGSGEDDGTMMAGQQLWMAPPPTTGAWLAAQALHGPAYQYTLRLTPEEAPKGNYHGLDLFLLFPPTDDDEKKYMAQLAFGRPACGEVVDKISADMIKCWTDFGKTGTVSFANIEWPPFPKRMNLQGSPAVGESQFSKESAEYKLWAEVMAETGIDPRQNR